MGTFQLSPESIIALTGVVISLVFSYFPALRITFGQLRQEVKSGVMLLLMALVVAVVAGLNCAGWINAGVTCDQVGLRQVVWWYFVAITGNQITYLVSPPAGDVKRAKLMRDYRGGGEG